MPNNEWLIVDTFASNYSIIVPENQPWDITEYVINVKRKPTFQFYGFILPKRYLSIVKSNPSPYGAMLRLRSRHGSIAPSASTHQTNRCLSARSVRIVLFAPVCPS